MARQVWIDYAFSMEVRKERQRKLHWQRLKGTAAVEIPEAAAFDAPDAIVTAYDKVPKPNKWGRIGPRKDTWTKGNISIGPSDKPGMETVRNMQAGHQGRLYRPVRAPGSQFDTATIDQVLNHTRHDYFDDHPFMKNEDRLNLIRRQLPSRDDYIDITVKETGRDFGDYMADKMQKVAADLLIVDGLVYRTQVEPVFIVSRAADAVEIHVERPYRTCERVGVPFRLDRYDDALAFARAYAGKVGLEVREPERRVEKADPAYLSLDMGVVAASLLGNAALRIGQDFIEGPVSDLALELRAATGGDQRGVSPGRVIGDPYDFADKLFKMSEMAGTRIMSSYTERSMLSFQDRMRRLHEPLRVARDMGLAPDAPVIAEEDADVFAGIVLEDDFVMPSPGM